MGARRFEIALPGWFCVGNGKNKIYQIAMLDCALWLPDCWQGKEWLQNGSYTTLNPWHKHLHCCGSVSVLLVAEEALPVTSSSARVVDWGCSTEVVSFSGCSSVGQADGDITVDTAGGGDVSGNAVGVCVLSHLLSTTRDKVSCDRHSYCQLQGTKLVVTDTATVNYRGQS